MRAMSICEHIAHDDTNDKHGHTNTNTSYTNTNDKHKHNT